MESYDRYAQFRTGDGFEIVPFGEVPRKGTDRYEIYKKGQTRLDQLSYQYYNSADLAYNAGKSSIWVIGIQYSGWK